MSRAEQAIPIRMFIPLSNERLFDVATKAVAQSMHLVSNGSQVIACSVIACSVIPVGWKKMAVKERQAVETRFLPTVNYDGKVLPP
jgi:hypothetical protein